MQQRTTGNLVSDEYRAKWIKYTYGLLAFTVVWNIAEGAVSLMGAYQSKSVSLLAFGLDSLIEVVSSIVVLVHMLTELRNTASKIPDDDNLPLLRASREGGGQGRKPLMSLQAERRSTLLIGILLVLLALFALVGGVMRLVTRTGPESTMWGIVVSSVSWSFMFVLWWYKTKAAVILDSSTLTSDANCSFGCLKLSTILLVGSLLFQFSHKLWWLDAVTVILIALNVGHEGYTTIKEARKDDFAGGCGCCSGSDTRLARYMRKRMNMDGNPSKPKTYGSCADECCPPTIEQPQGAGGCAKGCCSDDKPKEKGGGDCCQGAGGGDCCDDGLPDDFFTDDEQEA